MSPLAGHEGKAILGKRVPTGREQEFQPPGTRIPGIGNRGTNRREFPTHADDVFGKQPERISRTPFLCSICPIRNIGIHCRPILPTAGQLSYPLTDNVL